MVSPSRSELKKPLGLEVGFQLPPCWMIPEALVDGTPIMVLLLLLFLLEVLTPRIF